MLVQVTVHYRVLFERRVFKNDMASSAIKSYVFIGTSILVFGLLNAKLARTVLAKLIFFSLNSTSGGSRSYCTRPIIIISITIIIKKK